MKAQIEFSKFLFAYFNYLLYSLNVIFSLRFRSAFLEVTLVELIVSKKAQLDALFKQLALCWWIRPLIISDPFVSKISITGTTIVLWIRKHQKWGNWWSIIGLWRPEIIICGEIKKLKTLAGISSWYKADGRRSCWVLAAAALHGWFSPTSTILFFFL